MIFAAKAYIIGFLLFGFIHAWQMHKKGWDNFDIHQKTGLDNLIAWVLFFVCLQLLING
tara:strand:+ start:526 stop:702 length:177 start_codon:yes stop_codon:yes gene_type:complete